MIATSKMVGVKLNVRYLGIVSTAIERDIAENPSQVIKAALREFAKNHNLEVKEND